MNNKYLIANYMNSFFNDYLTIQRGLSGNTILAYRDALKLLFCFVADTKKTAVDTLTIEDLHQRVILDFLNHIEMERASSIRTRNARLSAIRTFFRFIAREEPALIPLAQKIRTIPQKREPHTVLDYLNNSEIQNLLSAINSDSKTAERDKALLLLMFNTGARAQEIVTLSIDNLRLDSCGQVTLMGKGNKQRACPLWKDTICALTTYLQHRNPVDKTNRSLFLNAHGGTITRFGVRYIVKKYATKAALSCPSILQKNVGPHTLRHSTAMHLIQSGNDINMVSIWLGHVDINTTHCYVEIDLEMKRAMLENTSPPKNAATKQPPWKKDALLVWLDALSGTQKLCEENSELV